MATIISDTDRVLCSTTQCTKQADFLDQQARTVLRRLMPQHAAVAAVGTWGRQDCHPDDEPMVFIKGQPEHVPFIMSELTEVFPKLHVVLESVCPLHLVELHNARQLWGHLPLPRPPYGHSFAVDWAASALPRLELAAYQPNAALAAWRAGRTILELAGLPVPGMYSLPRPIADLYVARNMGLPYNDPFEAVLMVKVLAALRHLRSGMQPGLDGVAHELLCSLAVTVAP